MFYYDYYNGCSLQKTVIFKDGLLLDLQYSMNRLHAVNEPFILQPRGNIQNTNKVDGKFEKLRSTSQPAH